MTGYFWEISPDDCGRLLADAAVGRVAWASSRGVQVLPVTLTSVGESVFFAVDQQSILAELAEVWTPSCRSTTLTPRRRPAGACSPEAAPPATRVLVRR